MQNAPNEKSPDTATGHAVPEHVREPTRMSEPDHEVRFHDREREDGSTAPMMSAAATATPAAAFSAEEHVSSDHAPHSTPEDEFDPVLKEKYSHSFLKKSYVNTLPEHLIPLANQIHQLDEKDLVLIADVADTEATTDVYSLLPYTGSNWFLPSIRECRKGERHWGFGYSWNDGLLTFIGGRRLNIRVLNILVRVAFIVLAWFMLWNMLPHWLVEPGGYVWDPLVLIVVSAIVGGLVCRILQIPPLVGVLWMGIMWNNIPELHYLTSGIVKQVFDICSKLGLTVILARAGYSLSLKSIRPHWKQSLLLATLPFALEGVSHSLIANKVFQYNDDYNWAFLQGMLCSIVSPAVVVPGTLYLQEMGYGRGVGPLSLMLSSVGVEIVIGVWCANFIIGLIFYDQKLAVAIVLGPVQFIGGIIIGVALGFAFFYVVELIKKEARRLPNGKYERMHFRSSMDFAFAIFLFASFTMVFLGYNLNLAGGGCVMCVFFAATVSHLWLKDGRKELEEQKKYLGSWLAFTWDQAMLPALFATMGAKINIMAIFNGNFFPKAIICLVSSTAVRLVVILCVQLGDGRPWKERFLVCVGYLGKASAQASVGPIAANLVADMIAKLPDDQKGSLATMARNANNVQQMSAMYVMFMAAIASLGLVRGGMVLLKKEEAAPKQPRTARGDPAAAAGGGGGGGDGRTDKKQQQHQQHGDADDAQEESTGREEMAEKEPAAATGMAARGTSAFYDYHPDQRASSFGRRDDVFKRDDGDDADDDVPVLQGRRRMEGTRSPKGSPLLRSQKRRSPHHSHPSQSSRTEASFAEPHPMEFSDSFRAEPRAAQGGDDAFSVSNASDERRKMAAPLTSAGASAAKRKP